jgi:hypothetical protein
MHIILAGQSQVIRKPLSLRQGLVLLAVGVFIGYPSLVATGHCAWGGGDCPNPKLLMAGDFVGAVCFVSGLLALLVIAIKSAIHSLMKDTTRRG